MVIEIRKGTPAEKIKSILKKKAGKKFAKKALDSFLGKLPNKEDGLTFQKKIRSEWMLTRNTHFKISFLQ